jgi:hypothetical protein
MSGLKPPTYNRQTQGQFNLHRAGSIVLDLAAMSMGLVALIAPSEE